MNKENIILFIIAIIVVAFIEGVEVIYAVMFLVFLLILIIIPFFIYEMLNSKKNMKKYRDERLLLDNKISSQKKHFRSQAIKYKKALAKKRTQLLSEDDYGDIDDSKWRKEILSFFHSKINTIPEELILPGEDKFITGEELIKIIDEVAKEGQKEFDESYLYSNSMNGFDYEHYCAKILKGHDWSVRVLQATNDQGADIIAEKKDISVAVQCKKYSQPVGNKAVQEVSASRIHYRTNHAIVVTNNTYTNSAKKLASSANVLLLHHSELTDLNKLLDLKASDSFLKTNPIENPLSEINLLIEALSKVFIENETIPLKSHIVKLQRLGNLCTQGEISSIQIAQRVSDLLRKGLSCLEDVYGNDDVVGNKRKKSLERLIVTLQHGSEKSS